jgi:hypothetical protein
MFKSKPADDVTAQLDEARAVLAAAQVPDPGSTFLDRIVALEKALAIVLRVLGDAK